MTSHRHVQAAAKAVLAEIVDTLSPASTEAQIATTCVRLLRTHGITETWYYDVPALVLLGSRSCLSVSGRDYRPAHEPAGPDNLITIDLSPLVGDVWGDCARSFVLENGLVTDSPQAPEMRAGREAQQRLHAVFLQTARPELTFEEVAETMNDHIRGLGFENLDFLGNLGHSIVKTRDERVYLERGNRQKMGQVDFFTFEPHIRAVGGRWGFKHENIYFFDGQGELRVL